LEKRDYASITIQNIADEAHIAEEPFTGIFLQRMLF